MAGRSFKPQVLDGDFSEIGLHQAGADRADDTQDDACLLYTSVWYLDLFAEKNDYAAVQRVAEGGHKEINRTNLTSAQTAELLENDVVRQQLALCQFRNTFPAFAWESDISVDSSAPHLLSLTWRHQGYTACLTADLMTFSFRIEAAAPDGIKNIIYEDLTYDI